MPASLTVQVRLGFSMGWRIWTPNEVGFYAKTLAHSYFILVILKAKFLKETIWIVNYNLFIGIRKYYVFIEFLKFGMKSKEERSYWRKIMYISLLLRHSVFTKKRKYFEANQGFRMKVIRRLINTKFVKAKRVYRWSKLHKKIVDGIVRKGYKVNLLQKLYDFTPYLKKSLPNYKRKLIKKTEKYISKVRFKTKNFIKILVWLKLKNSRKRIHKIGLPRILKKFKMIKNKIKYGKLFFKPRKNYFKTTLTKKFKKKLILKKTNNLLLHKKNKYQKLVNMFNRKSEKMYLHGKLKNTKNLATLRGDWALENLSKRLGQKTLATSKNAINKKKIRIKTVAEFFKLDIKKEPVKYSVFGGPRSRLSRNLRRSYKGKQIKNILNLIWFWEKISRLLSYYFNNHKLSELGLLS